MKKVKMKRESVWGKAGKVVEVTEGIAYGLVEQGAGEIVEPKARGRKKVSNKAMSAKTE